MSIYYAVNPYTSTTALPSALPSYTTQATTTTGSTVVVGGAQGTTIGSNYINMPTYTSPNIYGGNPGGGYGTISTDNTGNLTWNGNPLQQAWNNPSVSRVTDMLKDSLTREIVLCKDREECAKKYGEYGLKFFDSMLKEIIENAIKSEEAFTKKLKELTDSLEGAVQE